MVGGAMRTMRILTAAALFVAVAGATNTAAAADAPKWVAALYIEAQKMVGLRWTPMPGATGYKILRSVSPDKGYKEIGTSLQPQFLDKDLEPATTYLYALQTVAGADVSPTSEEKSVTIPGEKKKEAMLPPKWKGLSLQQQTEFGTTSFKVALSWDKTAGGVVGYNIYRSEVPGKDYQLVGSVAEELYVDATVKLDKTYYYVLSGTDSSFVETPYTEEKTIVVKLAEVKKEDKKLEALKLVMRPFKEVTTIYLGANNELSSPADTALNSYGDLYVLNAGTASVSVFGDDGTYKFKFGASGIKEGEISAAFGIGIDSDDNVFVADGYKILMFNAKGEWKKSFIIPAPVDPKVIEAAKEGNRGNLPHVTPFDVAETKDGNLAVSDNGFSCIVIIDKSGRLITSFSMYGPEDEQLKKPGSLAVNGKGDLWINDSQNRRGVIYGPNYKLKATVGGSKNMVGAFLGLYGAAVDESDNFIVSDPPMATIQFFDSVDGKYLHHMSDEKQSIDKDAGGQRPLLRLGNPAGLSYNKKTRTLYIPLTQANEVWVGKALN